MVPRSGVSYGVSTKPGQHLEYTQEYVKILLFIGEGIEEVLDKLSALQKSI